MLTTAKGNLDFGGGRFLIALFETVGVGVKVLR